MPQTSSGGRVLIFAKAPQPGSVKTRLIPALGAQAAAALHVRLVEHTLATACAADVGVVELHCAPDSSDAFFQMCASKYGIALKVQTGGDLGSRMYHAISEALTTSAHVIIIGTDCPVLSSAHLLEARQALQAGNDAVFVPAEDGGYALVGLSRRDARLFGDIAWGGPQVMAQTRGRLRELEWKWRELETLWDVDRPEDYLRLLKSGILAPVSTHA